MTDFTFKGELPPYAYDYVPKKAFDKEYSTQTRKEYEFLCEHGIEPSFVKTSEYGVRTYKYTKTSKLFRLLVEYYANNEAEKEYKKLEEAVSKDQQQAEPAVLDALIEHGAPIRKVRIYA